MVEIVPVPASGGNKNKNIIIALVSIIAVILLFTTGYLLMRSQSFKKSFTEAKEQNGKLEKDLIFYKSTNLAKEVELFNLKLKNAEEDLASTKTTLTKLQAGVSNVPQMTRIASLMMTTFGKGPPNCFSASDKTTINEEFTALGDREWISKWEDFINDTDAKNCSMSPDKLEQAVNYGLTKISEAVK